MARSSGLGRWLPRSHGLVLGLALVLMLGSCSSVDGDGTASDIDAAVAPSSSTNAGRADPATAGSADSIVKARAGSSQRSGSAPTEADRSSSDAARPGPAAASAANQIPASISDEQAARIAIRLAQGKATAAEKKALHAYLEDSR